MLTINDKFTTTIENKIAKSGIKKTYPKGMKTSYSPLSYQGSKRDVRHLMEKWFPVSFSEYREPFFGGGNIFLSNNCYEVIVKNIKDKSKIILNDRDYSIYCFWKMVRDCPKQLIDEACYIDETYFEGNREQLVEVWSNLKAARYNKDKFSEFQSAVATMLVNARSFCGRGIDVDTDKKMKTNLRKRLEKRIMVASEKLQGVTITNDDFSEVILADGSDVFIACDPPYDDTVNVYNEKMKYDLFAKLLKETKHKWFITHTVTTGHLNKVIDLSLNFKKHCHEYYLDGKENTKNFRKEVISANYHPSHLISAEDRDSHLNLSEAIATQIDMTPVDWAALRAEMGLDGDTGVISDLTVKPHPIFMNKPFRRRPL
jgi:DNA adenine methylase